MQEINLKWLLYRILMGWKRMLLSAVICAFLFNMVGYINSLLHSQTWETVDEYRQYVYGPLKADLTLEQIALTEDAARNYALYKEQYESILKYGDESILMNLDSTNVPTIYADYIVHTDDGERSKAKDIAVIYSTGLEQVEFPEEMLAEVPLPYLKELVRCYFLTASDENSIEDEESSLALRFHIVAKDEDMCWKILDAVKASITETSKILKEDYGNHEIQLLREKYFTNNDSYIKSQQDSYILGLKDAIDSMTTIRSNLISKQQKYYDELITEHKFTEKKKDNNPGIFHAKYALLGFMFGVMLVCVYEGFRYYAASTIYFADDFVSVFPLDIMGVFRGRMKKQEKKGIDNIIYKLFTKHEKKLPEEDAMALLCSRLRILMEKENMQKIRLIGTVDSELVRKVSMDISEKMGKLDVAYGGNALLNVNSMEDTASADGVILVEQLGICRRQEIKQELALCKKYKITVIGSVLVEQ